MANELREKLIDVIQEQESMDTEQVIDVWNYRCEEYKCYDDMIYRMYEVDDIFAGLSASELLDKIDRFDTSDAYFWVNESTGYFMSGDFEQTAYDAGELADFILENIDCMSDRYFYRIVDAWLEEAREND